MAAKRQAQEVRPPSLTQLPARLPEPDLGKFSELSHDLLDEILNAADCGDFPALCSTSSENWRALCQTDDFWKDLCKARGWFSAGKKPLFDEALAKQFLTFYRDQAVEEDKRKLFGWDVFATSSLEWKREFLFRCTFLSTANAYLGPFFDDEDLRKYFRLTALFGSSEAALIIWRDLYGELDYVHMAIVNQRSDPDRRPRIEIDPRSYRKRTQDACTLALPEGMTTLPRQFLQGAPRLRAVRNAGSLTSIELFACYQCVNLVTLDLPKGVKKIEKFAFEHCHNLALAALPEQLEEIGHSAFLRCHSLALTELPKSLRFIGDSAFRNCYGLKLKELPRSLKFVGDNAFDDCSEDVQKAERDWRNGLPASPR